MVTEFGIDDHGPRRVLPSLACVVTSAQMLIMGQATARYVSLFNGSDLGQWLGDPLRWKVERGALTGTSDGKSASWLFLGGRDYGDFELMFDLRVKHGAGGVQMRAQGMGPVGVELEVGTKFVRWLVNGSPALVVAAVKAGEWITYRVICNGGRFEV